MKARRILVQYDKTGIDIMTKNEKILYKLYSFIKDLACFESDWLGIHPLRIS